MPPPMPLRLIKKYRIAASTDTSNLELYHVGRREGAGAQHEQFQVVDAKTERGPDALHPAARSSSRKRSGGMPMFHLGSAVAADPLSTQCDAGHGRQFTWRRTCRPSSRCKQLAGAVAHHVTATTARSTRIYGPQFMNFRARPCRAMMSAYMDQSKNVFMQMQEQPLRTRPRIYSTGFPFPGFPGQPAAPKKDEGEKS